MKGCLRWFLPFLSLVALGSGYVYQCEPGTDATICSIWNLRYDDEQEVLPVVNIPSDVKKVRFVVERYYYSRKLHIIKYDTVLHSTVLHNPTSVELIDNRVRLLIMPPELQVGEFANNVISEVLTNSTKPYEVRYLDLSHNSLVNVDNLAVLVSLQTLNLEGNRISQLGPNTFSGMHNLSRLYLGDNSLMKFDFKMLPKGLTNLWLLRNEYSELNLGGVSLPALTELDLEANALVTIDLAALFTAFPALSIVPIANNPFSHDEAQRIITELTRRNVSYHFGGRRSSAECDSDEYELGHVCFRGSVLFVRSVTKALFLLVVGLLLLAVFVTSVHWIWYQMRY